MRMAGSTFINVSVPKVFITQYYYSKKVLVPRHGLYCTCMLFSLKHFSILTLTVIKFVSTALMLYVTWYSGRYLHIRDKCVKSKSEKILENSNHLNQAWCRMVFESIKISLDRWHTPTVFIRLDAHAQVAAHPIVIRIHALRSWSIPCYFCILWHASGEKCGTTQTISSSAAAACVFCIAGWA